MLFDAGHSVEVADGMLELVMLAGLVIASEDDRIAEDELVDPGATDCDAALIDVGGIDALELCVGTLPPY